ALPVSVRVGSDAAVDVRRARVSPGNTFEAGIQVEPSGARLSSSFGVAGFGGIGATHSRDGLPQYPHGAVAGSASQLPDVLPLGTVSAVHLERLFREPPFRFSTRPPPCHSPVRRCALLAGASAKLVSHVGHRGRRLRLRAHLLAVPQPVFPRHGARRGRISPLSRCAGHHQPLSICWTEVFLYVGSCCADATVRDRLSNSGKETTCVPVVF